MADHKLPQKMVLVSENCDEIDAPIAPESITSLEMSSRETTSYIVNGLKQFIPEVEIATKPKDLGKYEGENTLVMSVFGGENSRNRMALVPAVCEAYNIPFMGADAYARILCQDKHLSKIYAKELGLDSCSSVLIRASNDLELIQALSLPLVVKPNLEGSSIGIGENSLVHSHRSAAELTERLLTQFKQPILVEEFISGREISFCIGGTKNEINFFIALEDTNRFDPDFFLDKLYTANLKQNNWEDMIHIDVTHMVSSKLRHTIEKLYFSLGKVDYLRVDCRFDNDICKLIEITPDPYMGEGGAFSDAFEMTGLGFSEGLKLLVNNCVCSR